LDFARDRRTQIGKRSDARDRNQGAGNRVLHHRQALLVLQKRNNKLLHLNYLVFLVVTETVFPIDLWARPLTCHPPEAFGIYARERRMTMLVLTPGPI